MTDWKNKTNNQQDSHDETEGGTDSGSQIAFHDFIGNKGDITATVNDMRQALLGVAEVESGILNNIKDHLDKLLNHIYQQVREYQHLATLDAMVSDQPITKADPALIQGLDGIAQNLDEKNAAILNLRRELEILGADIFADSTMSAEMLRQQIEELNKRNKLLRSIHNELVKHPMITGQMPKGVTIDDVKEMFAGLNERLEQLNETNAELKAQIKQQKTQDNTPDKPGPQNFGRRR